MHNNRHCPSLYHILAIITTVKCFGGGVAQWLERRKFKSEDPSFDPLEGQGGNSIFLSLRVIYCANFFVPDSTSIVCTTRTQNVCAR